jgi:hypothetical protein
MPIHDWSRVEDGIFHDFHHSWIEEIKRVLNRDLLPPDHYALAEQHAGSFGPDVLTLQSRREDDRDPIVPSGSVLLAPPKPRISAETPGDFYRRKQNSVVVRHVTDDSVVAMVEIVSPGNKSSRAVLKKFVEKAAELFQRDIHLLVIDLHPPGPRDPRGIHGAIWEEVAGQEYEPPDDERLTVVSYEANMSVHAYIEPVAVGMKLPDEPLFLRPHGCVLVPLEKTYLAAWEAVPRRWREVLQPST